MTGLPDRRRLVEAALLLLLLGTLLTLSVRTLLPFLGIFMWAAILTVPVVGISERLAAAIGGRRRVAATLIGIGYMLLLALPMIYLSAVLGEAMTAAWATASTTLEHGIPDPPAWISGLPMVGARIDEVWRRDAQNLAALLADSRSMLLVVARGAVSQATDLLGAVAEIIIGIILATLLLASGPKAWQPIGQLARLVGGAAGELVLSAARRAILGVALGVVGTAVLEGAMAALGGRFAGFPDPVLLGFLAFGAAVVQIGPLLACLPAAAWLWWRGDPGGAAFFAVWAVLVVNGIDAFLKPYVMARTAKLPAFLMFFGVLGGLLAWGFSGMFLGATSLAIGWTMLRAWLEREPAA